MSDRIVAKREIYAGWFGVRMLTVRLATGETIEREIVEHPCGAAVLAYDPERRVALLVSEARPPVLHVGEPAMLEAIAGAIEGDTPEACARREALEEGGLALHALEPVGQVWPTPATSTERLSLFLAAYRAGDRVAPGGGLAEEQEHLAVREVPLATLRAMMDAGTIRDAKTLLLLQALRIRQPALFDPA